MDKKNPGRSQCPSHGNKENSGWEAYIMRWGGGGSGRQVNLLLTRCCCQLWEQVQSQYLGRTRCLQQHKQHPATQSKPWKQYQRKVPSNWCENTNAKSSTDLSPRIIPYFNEYSKGSGLAGNGTTVNETKTIFTFMQSDGRGIHSVGWILRATPHGNSTWIIFSIKMLYID